MTKAPQRRGFLRSADSVARRSGATSRDNASDNWGHSVWPILSPTPKAPHERPLRRSRAALRRALARGRQAASPPLRRRGRGAGVRRVASGRRRPPDVAQRRRAAATASTPTRRRRHALPVLVPPVRRHAVDAPRLHEPARRGDGAPTADRVDRARRGQGRARDVRRVLGAVPRGAKRPI